MAVPAWAGYSLPGYDLEVVQSGQGLAHAGISYLENSTWNGPGGNQYTPISTSFTLPSCDDIDFARLYLDIWGGMPVFTATVTVSVNGTQLAPISIGGMSDANPTYSGTTDLRLRVGIWRVGVGHRRRRRPAPHQRRRQRGDLDRHRSDRQLRWPDVLTPAWSRSTPVPA